jgi:uncharacterized damage-inducible protein DinB
MMKRFGSTAAMALALASTLALPVRAQAPKVEVAQESAKAEMKEGMAKSQGGVRDSILFQISQAQDKLIALAEAMPADKYVWKPASGVRTMGEVFNHVASANYFFPTLWGGKVPDGVDPRTLEKEMSGDKAKTVAVLKSSFENLRREIQAVPEGDLSRKINMFGHDATVRDAMMVLASHAHEHLGQSIAYARSNGVTPPWSAKEGQ